MISQLAGGELKCFGKQEKSGDYSINVDRTGKLDPIGRQAPKVPPQSPISALLPRPGTLSGTLNLGKGKNGGALTVGAEGSSEQRLSGGDGNNSVVETRAPPDWVTCPVCGNTIPGGDDMINSHLGLCI
ncbi:phosphodiesterase I [Sarracenia purpurea var. burkii]